MKQRLVGAAVLVLAAVIFVPMLLDDGGEAPPRQDRLVVPQPPQDSPARVVPLDGNAAPAVPAPAPAEPAARQEPPAKAPAKSAAGATPEGSGGTSRFAVQLGSFAKAENARGLRDKLVSRGYAAYVKTTGSVTRVYVGPQSSRAEAEKMLEKLLAETKLKGIVVKHAG